MTRTAAAARALASNRFVTRLLGLLVLASFLVVVPAAPPAQAADAIWSFDSRSGSPVPLQRGNATRVLSISCATGYTPVAGWVTSSQPDDLRRLSESYGLGSGQSYSVTIQNQTAGAEVIQVTPHVRCVATRHFTEGTLFRTTPVNHPVNDSTQLAEGGASCPPNYKVISGSVSVNRSAATLLTSAPDGTAAWFARAWAEDDYASMTVSANCVLASEAVGLKSFWTIDAVSGWVTPTTGTCPSGMSLVSAGTFHLGGDGGAVTIHQRPTTGSGLEGWAATAISDPAAGGWIQTRMLCMPAVNPTVQVSPTGGITNRTSVTWSFTISDPFSGYYSRSTKCRFDGAFEPCSSPQTRSNLSDGNHTLTVEVTTSDGRKAYGSSTVTVDTIAPSVTFDGAPNAVFPSSPTLGFRVADAGKVSGLVCWVDDATPGPCQASPVGDYRGARSVRLSGLADGSHVLHVKPTDEATNTATYDLPFTVDSVAPTVDMTKPDVRFQLSQSATAVWSGDDAGGIEEYEVRDRRAPHDADFGEWTTPTMVDSTVTSQTFDGLVLGSTYCFGVTAVDRAGNQSGESSRCTAVPLDDRSLQRSAGWTRSTQRGWFGGTAISTKQRGATLTVDATLARVALVAQKCSTCGVVGVYVDGTLVKKVDLSATQSSRPLILLPAFSLRTGTVKVKVLSSGKLVKVDALGVSRL